MAGLMIGTIECAVCLTACKCFVYEMGPFVDWWCGWTWIKEQQHRPVRFPSVSGTLIMGSLWIYLFIFSDVYLLPVVSPTKPLAQKPLTQSQKRLPLLQSTFKIRTLSCSLPCNKCYLEFCSIMMEWEKVLRAGREKHRLLQREQPSNWGKN